MALTELVLQAPADVVDDVCDALLEELGALSVSVDDADADTPQEQAIYGEPGMPVADQSWRRSRIRACFDSEAAATGAATALVAQDWTQGLRLEAIQAIPEQDWVRLTQSQFEPVCITPDFWVVPSWHEPPSAAQRIIDLDPGMAFGTGTHPTTRMCLRWIATQPTQVRSAWARVLDYGCGSGILAIACGLFGAGEIDAVDIDPAALEAARGNAQANGVGLRSASPEHARGLYPLVLANILATPLKLLAPLLSGHVAPGGHLVLAGILARQATELQEAYEPYLRLSVSDREDGWVLMTAQASAEGPTGTEPVA